MDSHNATIIGREDVDSGEFTVLGHVKSSGSGSNSNENTGNNEEIMLTQKFFKEIAFKMPNIDQIHLTGTGQIQEQFIKFLAETAQYKNAQTSHSTSKKMSDEECIAFFKNHYN